METFIERTEAALNTQLGVFCKNIPDWQETLGVSAEKVKAVLTGWQYMAYTSRQNDIAQQYALGFTAYKSQVRFGKANQLLGDMPKAPVYPADAPPVIQGNMQELFADLIQDCVRSKNFTEAIGQSLGIIRQKVPFVPEDGTPDLTGKTAQGGHPLLHAKISKYDAYEIWKDSGDTLGYKLCGTTTRPDYLDNSLLPVHNTSVTWKYKAIYMYKGQHVGNWSSEILVTVHGSV